MIILKVFMFLPFIFLCSLSRTIVKNMSGARSGLEQYSFEDFVSSESDSDEQGSSSFRTASSREQTTSARHRSGASSVHGPADASKVTEWIQHYQKPTVLPKNNFEHQSRSINSSNHGKNRDRVFPNARYTLLKRASAPEFLYLPKIQSYDQRATTGSQFFSPLIEAESEMSPGEYSCIWGTGGSVSNISCAPNKSTERVDQKEMNPQNNVQRYENIPDDISSHFSKEDDDHYYESIEPSFQLDLNFRFSNTETGSVTAANEEAFNDEPIYESIASCPSSDDRSSISGTSVRRKSAGQTSYPLWEIRGYGSSDMDDTSQDVASPGSEYLLFATTNGWVVSHLYPVVQLRRITIYHQIS